MSSQYAPSAESENSDTHFFDNFETFLLKQYQSDQDLFWALPFSEQLVTLCLSGAFVEVGLGSCSNDSSSGNKRKLGAAATGAIADGNPNPTQQVSTSDQQATNKGSNSLANLSTSSTVSPPSPQQAHSTAGSGETAPKARFKIGTTSELAQEEGRDSPRFADSQLGGVNGCMRTTQLNHKEEEREQPTR